MENPANPCEGGHVLHPPGPFPHPDPWKGCPPAACQWCGSMRLDFRCYGNNYAWCQDCYRESAPVSKAACWAAMQNVRSMGGNAQTWDPLSDMLDRLHASRVTPRQADPDLVLPSMSHASALALRALTRCDRDPARAIAFLQAWAAGTCEARQNHQEGPQGDGA
jgi:hypothetical protein